MGDKENSHQASTKSNAEPSDKPDANPNTEQRPNGSTDTGKKEAPKFDWVTQRSQCSLPKIFKTLRQEIEQDVKTRNGLRPANSPYEFSVTENGSDFSVALKLNGMQTSVTFSLTDHTIVVRDDKDKTQFEVTIAFDEEGQCKLYVNEAERCMWQVRRMALEELMFRGY
jgi:hypothetical protein